MKKFLFALAILLTVATLTVAMAQTADGATCTSGDGQSTCTGECCNSGPTHCSAGPCTPAGFQPRKDLGLKA